MNSGTKVLFDGFNIDHKEYSNIDGKKFSSHTDNINIKFFTPIYSGNKNLIDVYKRQVLRSAYLLIVLFLIEYGNSFINLPKTLFS